jgi:uncharacterized Zn finger protein (UPF0148 family)
MRPGRQSEQKEIEEMAAEGRPELQLKDVDPYEMIDFEQWQHMVDLLCRLANVKSAAITRLQYPAIEAFLVSSNPDTPFYKGLKVELARHYCEAVISKKDLVMVADARETEEWCEAPELAHGLVSYIGYPLFLPDGEVFGTICMHDDKKHVYSDEIQMLLVQFKKVVESHFRMARQADELKQALSEVERLEGMLPICSYCRKIRNDKGYWQMVEKYFADHSGLRFSHSICPDCAKEQFPEFDLYKEKSPGRQ